MIYVDRMGHLFSDSSWRELHDFAVNKLNLKPEWNHYSRHFLHFDLTTKRKIKKAIELGAKQEESHENARMLLSIVKAMNEREYKDNYHLDFWYESAGLYGQKILRVDFDKLKTRWNNWTDPMEEA